MKIKFILFIGILFFAGFAMAFECPQNLDEAPLEANVLELIRTGRANFVFTEDILIRAGESRAYLDQARITDLNGVSPLPRRVKAAVPRPILTYDFGHSEDFNYYVYTKRLRLHFEGSRYHPDYASLRERSGDKIRVCLLPEGAEIDI